MQLQKNVENNRDDNIFDTKKQTFNENAQSSEQQQEVLNKMNSCQMNEHIISSLSKIDSFIRKIESNISLSKLGQQQQVVKPVRQNSSEVSKRLGEFLSKRKKDDDKSKQSRIQNLSNKIDITSSISKKLGRKLSRL